MTGALQHSANGATMHSRCMRFHSRRLFRLLLLRRSTTTPYALDHIRSRSGSSDCAAALGGPVSMDRARARAVLPTKARGVRVGQSGSRRSTRARNKDD